MVKNKKVWSKTLKKKFDKKRKKKKFGQERSKTTKTKVSSKKKKFGQNKKTFCEGLAKINFANQNFSQKKR